MPESLLTPSSIKLFGRIMLGLTIDPANLGLYPVLGRNNFLRQQLEGDKKQLPCLARIYGFSFEGSYYSLPRPSMFLVHGDGLPVGSWSAPSTVDQSGVIAREWDFSGPENDLMYWEYEKGDFSIRVDTEAGPFEQILLAAALQAGADMAGSGAQLGVRSGAQLSGAQLSGAQLSGAQLSGAQLGLRNRR